MEFSEIESPHPEAATPQAIALLENQVHEYRSTANTSGSLSHESLTTGETLQIEYHDFLKVHNDGISWYRIQVGEPVQGENGLRASLQTFVDIYEIKDKGRKTAGGSFLSVPDGFGGGERAREEEGKFVNSTALQQKLTEAQGKFVPQPAWKIERGEFAPNDRPKDTWPENAVAPKEALVQSLINKVSLVTPKGTTM